MTTKSPKKLMRAVVTMRQAALRHANMRRAAMLQARIPCAFKSLAMRASASATLLIMVLLYGAAPAAAQGNALQTLSADSAELSSSLATQPAFLPVEEAYVLAVEQEDARTLRLIWQMPPGYYLYKHAFEFSISGAKPSPTYPVAITREDEFFGVVEVYYDSVDITLSSPVNLAGEVLSVTSQGCADAGLCYPPRTQTFTIAADGAVAESLTPAITTQTPASAPAGSASALLLMLVFAFLGGAILNLMPCVLPILSLKVLSFAMATPHERHHHGLLYSAGVIVSFLLVATLLLVLRGAGQAIGWGFQLQSPGFVIGLAYLFVVLGLALSGFIELGNRFMNLGSGLADKGGATGSFFTGVLAVVVASPCTAPFMGSALGYALVQPAYVGLAVFAALGAGMAAPMLLLSYSEIARTLLPKPGAWMDRLKQALAFPLYATALWLFWVAGRQAGVDLMAAALLGALLVAMSFWLWRGALVARGIAVVCIGLAVSLASWRPETGPESSTELPAGSVAFSAENLENLRSDGQAVFVDVTADWCITCLANERAVLGSDDIQAAFRSTGVTYMVADWTDYDPTIADFVASHGRSGIPLYVMYNGQAAPKILPQLLRKQTVLNALSTAANVATTANVAITAAR